MYIAYLNSFRVFVTEGKVMRYYGSQGNVTANVDRRKSRSLDAMTCFQSAWGLR